MKKEIKNIKYNLVAASKKGHHKVVVSFFVNDVNQKKVILIKDRSKWSDKEYLKEAEKQFNKAIKSTKIESSKNRGGNKPLIILTSIFGVATLALGGFLAYKYLTGGSQQKQKYAVTWLDWDGTILEQDTNVEEGTIPSFDFVNAPSKPYDGANFWSFKSWDREVEKVTNYNQTYVAHYNPLVIEDDVDAYIRIAITKSDDLTFGFDYVSCQEQHMSVDWGDGVRDELNSHEYAKPGVYDVKIKNVISVITLSAFKYHNCIKELYLGEDIESINELAFERCNNLKTAIILGSSIGKNAFTTCPLLTYVSMPNVTSLGDNAFCNCSSLTSITIPSGVSALPARVFWNCDHLTSVNLPNTLTSIGYGAFESCSSLSSIDLSSVTEIKEYAFQNCSSLIDIGFSDNLASIGVNVFQNCSSIKSIVLPDSITSIPNLFCWGCSSLNSFIAPGVNQIQVQAFYNCSSLSSVEFGTVTTIKDEAFYNCSSLSSIDLSSVTEIGKRAFYNCSSLSSANIPNATEIDEQVFKNCTSLESLVIDGNITNIYAEMCLGCSNLTFVSIPNTVKYIFKSAFEGCSFDSIDLPNSLEYIYERAFYGNNEFTSIVIPHSVICIHESAFEMCENLESIDLTAFDSNYVPEIYDKAFTNTKAFIDKSVRGFKVSSENMRDIFIEIGKADAAQGKTTWPVEEDFYEVVTL